MKIVQLFFLLLILVAVSACDPQLSPETPVVLPEDPTALEIVCPDNMLFKISSPTVLSTSLNIPVPTILSSCNEGSVTITSNLPEYLEGGVYEIDFLVTDSCSQTAQCSFYLTVEYDFLGNFVGTYTGRERATYNYGQIVAYDSIRTVLVAPSDIEGRLLIDGDKVLIDSTGHFPYPSCCDYRWYRARFSNDSLFTTKVSGTLGGGENGISFRGKKN